MELRERRIRSNLDVLARILRDASPTQRERFRAWLADQEAEEMNEKAITLRLPADLLERADELVPIVAAYEDFQAMRVSRSTVLRLALLRGLAALEHEFELVDE
jgi:hypothetical protein